MYIWILLATLMVALSFFNLSPRPDKDHALNEIRAATVVNRFKAEHLAMAKYMECEIVKQVNNANWDGPSNNNRSSADGPVKVIYAGDDNVWPNLYYTKFSCYLPRNYDYSKDIVDVKHFIFCLDGIVEEDGPRNFKACNETSYRYLVSFAQIPDRWRSHDWIGKGASKPAPLFMSFVSKPTSGGSTYGWTDCTEDGCILRGYSSRAGKYSRDDKKTQIYEYTLLDKDSILWNKEQARASAEDTAVSAFDYCKLRPCLFAYMYLPTADVSNHCYRMLQKDNNNCNDYTTSTGEDEPDTPQETPDTGEDTGD